MERELDYKAIGIRVKIARVRAGMKQEQVAEKTGLSPTHISSIETGITKASLAAFVSVANAIGVTVDDFLCDNLIHARVQFERDIAELIEDCDDYEIRMVKDMTRALIDTLRRDAHLRQ